MADPTFESGRFGIQTVWIGHSVARRMGGAAIGSELDIGASIPRIDPVMPRNLMLLTYTIAAMLLG